MVRTHQQLRGRADEDSGIFLRIMDGLALIAFVIGIALFLQFLNANL